LARSKAAPKGALMAGWWGVHAVVKMAEMTVGLLVERMVHWLADQMVGLTASWMVDSRVDGMD
jgi:hypothetical protein